MGDRVLLAESRDVSRLRGVDPRSDEALVVGETGDGPLGATGIVVGHDHPLEEAAPSRDRDDRAPDTTRTDDEDPHTPSAVVGRGAVSPTVEPRVASLRGPGVSCRGTSSRWSR